jgi:hypothetical protein
MPTLLTQGDVDSFTGDFKNLFDTFKREIVIWKEPQKIVKHSNVETTLYAGYKPQHQVETEWVPNSGVFEAMVTYGDKQDTNNIADIKVDYFGGGCRIKIEQPGRDFIENGKTERLDVDGKSFNIVTSDAVKDFFGFKLFVYHLENTK